MTINAGNLRERVMIEHNKDKTDDGSGGYTDNWLPQRMVAAEVLPTGGREALISEVLTATQGWRVTIRYRRDMTVDNRPTERRFNWKGLLLNIRNIADPDGSKESLVAFCESGVAS